MGHDVRIKVVFDYECPLLEPRILTNPHMIQTGHIWFFQLAVCFWVLGLPLFFRKSNDPLFGLPRPANLCSKKTSRQFFLVGSLCSELCHGPDSANGSGLFGMFEKMRLW